MYQYLFNVSNIYIAPLQGIYSDLR